MGVETRGGIPDQELSGEELEGLRLKILALAEKELDKQPSIKIGTAKRLHTAFPMDNELSRRLEILINPAIASKATLEHRKEAASNMADLTPEERVRLLKRFVENLDRMLSYNQEVPAEDVKEGAFMVRTGWWGAVIPTLRTIAGLENDKNGGLNGNYIGVIDDPKIVEEIKMFSDRYKEVMTQLKPTGEKKINGDVYRVNEHDVAEAVRVLTLTKDYLVKRLERITIEK